MSGEPPAAGPDPWADSDEGDPLADDGPAVHAGFHFGGQAFGALLLVLMGILGAQAASAGMGMQRFVRLLEELGLALPMVTELVIRLHLNLFLPIVAAVSAALVIGVAFLRKPLVSWVVLVFLLLVIGLPTSLCMVSGYVMGNHLAAVLGTSHSRPPVDPGKTSKLVDRIVDELRATLERGVGTVRTPRGTLCRYVVLSGPGLPDPSAELPPYDQARKLPGCVLLPWSPQPGFETALHMPAGPTAPAAAELDGSEGQAPPWVVRGEPDGMTRDGVPAWIIPATIDVDGDLSYGFTLRQARVDSSDDGVRRVAGAGLGEQYTLELRLDSRDGPSEELLEVELRLYRGFDPTVNPARVSVQSGWGSVVPECNLPVETFKFLLRVPR